MSAFGGKADILFAFGYWPLSIASGPFSICRWPLLKQSSSSDIAVSDEQAVISPLDKEMWLQLAADWMSMAAVHERLHTDQPDRD